MRAIPTDPLPIPSCGEPIPIPLSIEGDRGSPAPTGVTRRAIVRVHTCHAPILAGLDADRAALAVAVDPYPLTCAGEVWALRAERPTYLLHAGRLERRDRWSIAGTPAGIAVVMAEHRCGLPPPPEMRTPAAPPVRQLEQVAW